MATETQGNTSATKARHGIVDVDTITKNDLIRGLLVFVERQSAEKYANRIFADAKLRRKEPTDKIKDSDLDMVKEILIVHHCPKSIGEDVTRCCGRLALEFPENHKFTSDISSVTCKG